MLSTPTVIPVTYSGDPMQGTLEAFTAGIVGSSYWSVIAEYVGQAFVIELPSGRRSSNVGSGSAAREPVRGASQVTAPPAVRFDLGRSPTRTGHRYAHPSRRNVRASLRSGDPPARDWDGRAAVRLNLGPENRLRDRLSEVAFVSGPTTLIRDW